MIFVSGHLLPTSAQIKHAREYADESFCTNCSKEFMNSFPNVEGWEAATDRAILLKLRNVEPHSDPWVSNGNEPIRYRRAVFWLLEGGGQSAFGCPLIFGCGDQHVKMKPGDFVVFDDRIDHWVMSEKKWRGAAVQLRKVKR